ncbi:MAG: glycosyltransferase [Chloroflexi bacterium]|nr:glycosyltransferase [Chloroflexota bacterium]
MRIGIVTSSYPTSPSDTVNAGVFVRDLAKELVGLGHEVHVMTPSKYGGEKSLDLDVHYIPWIGGEKDLASASMGNPLTAVRLGSLVASGLLQVGLYARGQNLDALLAMWAIPSGLFAWSTWRRYGIPYGVWVLGSDLWARSKYPFGDRIVRHVLQKASFRFADGVKLAQGVEELAQGTCEFVPSVRRLPVRAESREASLTTKGTRFLFVGRYETNKGPDLLIEAMRLLLENGEQADLYLFGGGSLEKYLRKKIVGYEKSIHLGTYADPDMLVSYMRACDWLIIPSRIESIPLVFSDALQMRLPMIASDVGDLGLLVRQYGVGKVVPSSNPTALAQVMREALSIPRAEFYADWGKALQAFNLAESALKCSTFLRLAEQKT